MEIVENNEIIEVVSKSDTLFGKFNHTLLLNYNTKPMPRLTIYSIYLHWSAVAILAANRLFGGWRGFGLRSTPRQSNKITGRRSSGSGDSRLVLVTVVWFWQWSFPTCLPTYLPACLPVSVFDSIRERGRPDRRL